MRLLECLEELGASLNRRSRLVPRRPRIRSPVTAVRWLQGYVVATSACRRLADKLGLFQGGSWRARVAWAAPSTAEPAADAGVPPRELCRRRCRAPVRLGGLL